MARGAGENVKGIFGSQNWHWSLQDEGSKAFVQVLRHQVRLPAQPGRAHLLCQTLLYADAVNRAGRSTPARWSKRSKASSSTVWATARPFTVPKTTSASRTCSSCAARRTRERVRPSGNRRGHAGRAGHLRADHPQILAGDLGACNPGA
jgi:branched-chain amino acid transport system substrate-binding protein